MARDLVFRSDVASDSTRLSAMCGTEMSTAVVALELATGGSLCVRSRRLPHDWPELLRSLDARNTGVQLIVCMGSHEWSSHQWNRLSGPMPIEIPPLGVRETELPRIIQAYADEAIATLQASPSYFSDEDLDWMMTHSPRSLSEIEKVTLRIVALRKGGTVQRTARMLGMAPVSLSRWLDRRRLPTVRMTGLRGP